MRDATIHATGDEGQTAEGQGRRPRGLERQPDAGFATTLARGLAVLEAFGAEARMAAEIPATWEAYRDAAREGVAQCRTRGFCFSAGEWIRDVHAVATPLFRDPDYGDACVALNCGVPAFRLRPGEMEAEIGPRLVQLASTIRAACRTGRGP